MCNRHINNRVAEGHELVNMKVAHFKHEQLEKLIVQRDKVKYGPDNWVNADMGKFCIVFSTQKLYSSRCLTPYVSRSKSEGQPISVGMPQLSGSVDGIGDGENILKSG